MRDFCILKEMHVYFYERKKLSLNALRALVKTLELYEESPIDLLEVKLPRDPSCPSGVGWSAHNYLLKGAGSLLPCSYWSTSLSMNIR